MLGVLAERYPDIAQRSARGIAAPDGTQAWVVSGARYTCFGADNEDGTGYTCAPNSEAARRPVTLVSERQKDGWRRTVALVPDAIPTLSVGAQRAAAKNNLVVAEHPGASAVQANPNDGRAPFRVGAD